ncbi:MAG: DUF3467 domain-containing protein [Patescibacteria group bacterium]|nr:DUF3467 domain-containing protein [Patescibacteria group bacterium]
MTQKKQQMRVSISEDMKSGVYSNAVSVTVTNNELVLDFAYMMPAQSADTEKNLKVVSRVNMTMGSAENLLSVLQTAILDFKEKQTKK